MSVSNLKGGAIFWICVKDHIIDERRTTQILDYMGLILNDLRKRRMGGLERD